MGKEDKIVFNKKSLREFKTLIKKGYHIKSYSDRLEYVDRQEISRYIEQYSELIAKRFREAKSDDERSAIDTSNIYHEIASTYIFRSPDIDSERTIDYSHYRDENKFRSRGIGKKKTEEDKLKDELRTEIKKDRRLPDKVKEEIAASVPDTEFIIYDSDVNKMFSYRELSESKAKKIIKNGMPGINETMDENLRSNILGVYYFLKSACKTSEDNQTIDMLSKGLSDVEIAREAGVSKQAVGRRFKKIFKNAKKMVD